MIIEIAWSIITRIEAFLIDSNTISKTHKTKFNIMISGNNKHMVLEQTASGMPFAITKRKI